MHVEKGGRDMTPQITVVKGVREHHSWDHFYLVLIHGPVMLPPYSVQEHRCLLSEVCFDFLPQPVVSKVLEFSADLALCCRAVLLLDTRELKKGTKAFVSRDESFRSKGAKLQNGIYKSILRLKTPISRYRK